MQGAFGTDFYDRSILRPKHRAYYRSGRPLIKIGSKGALGSHEIRPIHSAPSLGQSILIHYFELLKVVREKPKYLTTILIFSLSIYAINLITCCVLLYYILNEKNNTLLSII